MSLHEVEDVVVLLKTKCAHYPTSSARQEVFGVRNPESATADKLRNSKPGT